MNTVQHNVYVYAYHFAVDLDCSIYERVGYEDMNNVTEREAICVKGELFVDCLKYSTSYLQHIST